ncbi:MAG: hypothetical protein JWO30_985 [Fibrobacteres bacterium]|nr:hypothetical protein [Fibrobacterota bacterium]
MSAAAALVTCALLAACSGKADGDLATGPATAPAPAHDTDSETKAPDTASLENLLRKSGADVAAFHGNVAALDRISGLMNRAPAPRVPARTGPGSLAYPDGSPGAWTGAAPAFTAHPVRETREPDQALTVLEAVPPELWFEGDTSWFDYGDTASGRVRWIHVFHDSEEELHALVRDSMVYRWPYDPGAPILVSSCTRVRNIFGGEYLTDLADDDGDGDLNASRAGKPLRIRKEWTAIAADTLRKTVWRLEQGGPEDSLGNGVPLSFAESTFIGGRIVSWTETREGDGDGYMFRAAAGAGAILSTDAFVAEGDGTTLRVLKTYGPGADGDFATAEDNPVFFHSERTVRPDGSESLITRAPKRAGTGIDGSDTVVVRERNAWPHPVPGAAGANGELSAGRDSTWRVSWMLPGDPENPADDLIAWWSDRTWSDRTLSGQAGTPIYASQEFTAAGSAVPAGKEPVAGVLVREEEYAGTARADGPVADRKIKRFRRSDVFDHGKKLWAWDERRYYPDGDSATESGRLLPDGACVYAGILDKATRASGWFDAGTNLFRDTVRHLENPAGGTAYAIHAGAYKAGDGTGDYVSRRVSASGDSTVTRILIARESGDRYRITALTDGDSGTYFTGAGGVTWTARRGDTTVTLTSIAREDGAYGLLETIADGKGTTLVQGKFSFRTDGSGSGTLKGFAIDGAAGSAAFGFAADGAVSMDVAGTDAGPVASTP